MLPYRMTQTRRALIRRALAAAGTAPPPPIREWEGRPKPRIARPIDHQRFAYLASPEAAAAMRRWQAARKHHGE